MTTKWKEVLILYILQNGEEATAELSGCHSSLIILYHEHLHCLYTIWSSEVVPYM